MAHLNHPCDFPGHCTRQPGPFSFMTKDDQDETRLLLEEIESFQNQFEASRGRSERTTDEYLAPGEPYQWRHRPQAKKLGRLD